MSETAQLEDRWATQAAAWRDPEAVVAGDESVIPVDRAVLRCRARGAFWETLAEHQLTVLVSREYENLTVGLSVVDEQPHLTHLPLPHPSGIAFDSARGEVHVAATRNPNQVLTFAPLASRRERDDVRGAPAPGRPLMPVRSRFLPGCMYLHDVAMIGSQLHANAVGENAVIRFDASGTPERVWWPTSIEGRGGPDFGRNYLQLNSIAAGVSLARSFFSATCEAPGRRRPGHLDFPVDRRGVIFSGATREVFARGLTRPHSSRLRGSEVWVANSGYGELGVCRDGRFEPALVLPGWTRGLCVADDLAIVGTSRVIPRYARYAPGLDVKHSVCGIHIVDLRSLTVLGSLIWPLGNQIFAVETLPSSTATGFAHLSTGRASRRSTAQLYYNFDT